jgi:hypothetical protein
MITTSIDEKLLGQYKDMLSEKDFTVEIQLGFGKPNKVIPRSSIKEISTFWCMEPTVILVSKIYFWNYR